VAAAAVTASTPTNREHAPVAGWTRPRIGHALTVPADMRTAFSSRSARSDPKDSAFTDSSGNGSKDDGKDHDILRWTGSRDWSGGSQIRQRNDEHRVVARVRLHHPPAVGLNAAKPIEEIDSRHRAGRANLPASIYCPNLLTDCWQKRGAFPPYAVGLWHGHLTP
jgi:hypothetical protein